MSCIQKIDLNSIAKYLQYRGMNGNDIDLDSFVVHCVPEKWYLPEFWTKWSLRSAILWHCLLSNCLLKDHNRSKLTRLSDWKMTFDAELVVYSKSVSWMEALKKTIVTLF